MQHIRNRMEVSSVLKAKLPKDFEFKLFGKLILDLEELTLASSLSPEITLSLQSDFVLARRLIRARDSVGLAGLADRLSTQSMLKKRLIHCGADALAFYIQYQLGAFLKKYPFTGADTKSPAITSFVRAERTCHLFNTENFKALQRMDATGHYIFGDCIAEMRDDIEKLLGSVPDFGRVEQHASHGPGVAVSDQYKHGKSTSYYKWSSLPYTVTAGALKYAKEAIKHDPRWIGALDYWYRSRCANYYAPIDLDDFWSRILSVVDGSRITTVPKSAKTDRTIAIEPMLNVYLQLGVDHIFKSALKKRWKYDLTNQKANRDLAQEGAKDGSYATIDLSAASDTVSLKICEMLLPEAWFDLLCDLRSPKGVLMGKQGSFDKISSMGNGFTFALESLIFGAIVRHCMRRFRNRGKTAVYGDDLIVPSEVAPSVIELLSYCGFSTNDDKTFIDGPFRESCGSDWFLWYNVRPMFLKRRISTVLDLFYVHNRLFTLEMKLHWSWEVHFRQTRAYVRKYIPIEFENVYGPPSQTLDGYLFSNRKLHGTGLHRSQLAIVARPNKFNRNSDFLFRKLMASLKGASAGKYRWDEKRELTSGNAFDITKRGNVQYFCTKREIYLDFLAAPLLSET